MSDMTQAAVPPAQQQSITVAEAAERFAAKRAAAQAQNSVSDAARTLGQRAAQARQERMTQATSQAENASPEETQHVEDEQTQQVVEPQDESATAAAETPEATETQADATAQEDGPIDIGEGVSLTKAEIRESILLKADHTRRLMDLAEKRKAFEGTASQKLAILEQATELLGQRIGKPKPLSAFMKEMGDPVAAAEAFDAQQEQIQAFHAARELRNRQQAEQIDRAIEERDEHLAAHYNKEWADPKKLDEAQTALSQYAIKLGAKEHQLRALTDPWMIEVIDKSMKFDALEAQKSKVTTTVGSRPPVIRPGTKISAGAAAQSKVQQALAQLRQSGSHADAVALLQARRAARG